MNVFPICPYNFGHIGLCNVIDSLAIVEPFVPPEALIGRVPIRRGRKAIILENKATSGRKGPHSSGKTAACGIFPTLVLTLTERGYVKELQRVGSVELWDELALNSHA